jgi:Mlc titration factor MtfA (ptsG expression regulator)
MFDDLIHEVAHSLEEPHGYEIYGDKRLQNEFLKKRKQLHDILWAHGYKAPAAFFSDSEYNIEFDDFLFNKIGYDKLALLMQGLFITPYAATSLREYFATGFTEFYLDPNHTFLKSIGPALYQKLFKLQHKKSS